MHTAKIRQFVAVGLVAASLAVAGLGATAVSANQFLDDASGSNYVLPAPVQSPFTTSYYVNALSPLATQTTAPVLSGPQFDDSADRGN